MLPQAGDEPAYRLLTKMLKDWINDDNSLAKVKASIYNDLLTVMSDDMDADFNALIDVFLAKQAA